MHRICKLTCKYQDFLTSRGRIENRRARSGGGRHAAGGRAGWRRSPSGGEDFGQTCEPRSLRRGARRMPRFGGKQGGRPPVRPLPVPANRCNRPACRRASAVRPPFAAGVFCSAISAPIVEFLAQPGHVGMAADGAGGMRRARRPARRQNLHRSSACHSVASATTIRASSPSRVKLSRKPRHAIG